MHEKGLAQFGLTTNEKKFGCIISSFCYHFFDVMSCKVSTSSNAFGPTSSMGFCTVAHRLKRVGSSAVQGLFAYKKLLLLSTHFWCWLSVTAVGVALDSLCWIINVVNFTIHTAAWITLAFWMRCLGIEFAKMALWAARLLLFHLWNLHRSCEQNVLLINRAENVLLIQGLSGSFSSLCIISWIVFIFFWIGLFIIWVSFVDPLSCCCLLLCGWCCCCWELHW